MLQRLFASVILVSSAVAFFACLAADTHSMKDGLAETIQAALEDASECPENVNIIEGTAGDDTLLGTDGNDCILGYGGNDTLEGGAGDDFLSGGDGDDQLHGEQGADELYGGLGSDSLHGGNGDDMLDGGDGPDDLVGGNGADVLYGRGGNDVIAGGRGDDTIDGGPGNDIIAGGRGDDTLGGGDGNDLIAGGQGTDTVDGGRGEDSCDGTNCEVPDQTPEDVCAVDSDCHEPGQTCVPAIGICVFCREDSDCDDGDACTADACTPIEGCSSTPIEGSDADSDGVCDNVDQCVDADQDGLGNGNLGNADCAAEETDSDDANGNVCADVDADFCEDCSGGFFAPNSDGIDTDSDGLCDVGDPDDDDDAVPDEIDVDPTNPWICQDADSDMCDDCSVSGGPPDPANDGPDNDGNGVCDDAGGGCDPGWTGENCDLVEYCLGGSFVVTDALDVVNGNPATGVFEHLETSGGTIDYEFRFGIESETTTYDPADMDAMRELHVGSLAFQMTGDSTGFLRDTFAAALDGQPAMPLMLIADGSMGYACFGNQVSPRAPEYWGFEFGCIPTTFNLDSNGFPLFESPITSTSTGIILRRYQTGTPLMTDFASATGTVTLDVCGAGGSA